MSVLFRLFSRRFSPVVLCALFVLMAACTPPDSTEPTVEQQNGDASVQDKKVKKDDKPPVVDDDIVVPDDPIPNHPCETPKQTSPLLAPPTLLRSWQAHGPTSFYVRNWSLFALNKDQSLAVVAFEDSRFARIIDTRTSKTVRVLSGGHTQGIYSVAFSPDGKTIATGGYDDIVVLWETSTGTLLHTLKERGDVRLMAFSPDSKTLASTSTGDRVHLWEVATGKMKFEMTGHKGDTWSVAWHPSGDWLASGSSDGTVRFWDAKTGKVKLTFGSKLGVVMRLQMSSDGKQLLVGSNSDHVRLWNLSNPSKPTQVFAKKLNGDIVGLGFLPDRRNILALVHRDKDSVHILNRSNGQETSKFHKLYYPTHGVLSSDGKSLWQIQRGFGQFVKTELASKNNTFSTFVHERREVGAGLYNEGKGLVTLGRRDRELWLRDPRSGVAIRRLAAPKGVIWTTLTTDPKDFRVYLSAENGAIHVWDLRRQRSDLERTQRPQLEDAAFYRRKAPLHRLQRSHNPALGYLFGQDCGNFSRTQTGGQRHRSE